MDKRVEYIACERCGGVGEVEVRPSVGPYEDPTPDAEICSACEGTGRFCVEPDEPPAQRPQEPEITF
jgi:DnaJ-class molecular chaperone